LHDSVQASAIQSASTPSATAQSGGLFPATTGRNVSYSARERREEPIHEEAVRLARGNSTPGFVARIGRQPLVTDALVPRVWTQSGFATAAG
jgi:hypothetical protein